MKPSPLLLVALCAHFAIGCADGIAPSDDATAEPVPADVPAAKAAPAVDRAGRADAVRSEADAPEAAPAAAPDEAPATSSKRTDSGRKRATERDDSGADDDAEAVDVDAALTVKRLVIASGVSGREPVGAATTFTAGAQDRIYAFVEVGNPDGATSEVSVSFFKDGGAERGGVKLRVGASPRWRTWSFTRLAKEPGTWHAVVRNAKGEELARTRFEIVAGATPAKAGGAETGEKIDGVAKAGDSEA